MEAEHALADAPLASTVDLLFYKEGLSRVVQGRGPFVLFGFIGIGNVLNFIFRFLKEMFLVMGALEDS